MAAIPERENHLGMRFRVVGGVWFSVWETRVRDFAAFVEATGYDAGNGWREPGFPQGDDHPVVNVSWIDVHTFCRWLTAGNHSYRLPTDAEWSQAVGLENEQGATPAEKRENGLNSGIYPWGHQWPPPLGAGNYCDETAKKKYPYLAGYVDSFAATSPVGRFAATPAGLYDLSGNVWEWCEDWYDAQQTARVLRGGSWICDKPVYLLSSYRDGVVPAGRYPYIGFRCVLVSNAARIAA